MTFWRYIANFFLILPIQYVVFVVTNGVIIVIIGIILAILLAFLCALIVIIISPCMFCSFYIINESESNNTKILMF